MSFKKKLKKVASLTAASALITSGSLLINSDPANAALTSRPAECNLGNTGKKAYMTVGYTKSNGIIYPETYMISTDLTSNQKYITSHSATFRDQNLKRYYRDSPSDIWNQVPYVKEITDLPAKDSYTFWAKIYTYDPNVYCTTTSIKID